MKARNPYAPRVKYSNTSRDRAKVKREYLTQKELKEVSPRTITSCRGFVACPEKGETRLKGTDHDNHNLARAMEVYIRRDNVPQLF